MHNRHEHSQTWLNQQLNAMGHDQYTIAALPGDASFRRYFRIEAPEQSFLFMDAPPELENSYDFSAISKTYRTNNIHTPIIFAEDLECGFLLIEDFGHQLLSKALTENSAEELYRRCYEILPHIQACQKIPGWDLPSFVEQLLDVELKNFHDWCLIQFAELKLSASEENLIQQTFAQLKASAAEQPQVGVHRDYHSRNLMVLPDGKIGVIDFQDAVIGPFTYDLVSLLRDCYIAWPIEKVHAWVKNYFDTHVDHKQYSFEQYHRWFDWMGIQRHLKAIFIFCRKYLRDSSTSYLNDIPRTLNYVLTVSGQYSELKSFHDFIEQRLAPPLLARIEKILSEHHA
jgi:aminoglycoside/choline kinase family phosphotransferase